MPASFARYWPCPEPELLRSNWIRGWAKIGSATSGEPRDVPVRVDRTGSAGTVPLDAATLPPGARPEPCRPLPRLARSRPGSSTATTPRVVAFAADAVGDATDPTDKAVRLFYAVRDGFRYDPYNVSYEPEDFRASSVVESPSNWCVPKSVLLTAAARSQGIPARLGFADVRNHLTSEKLKAHDEHRRVRLARLQRAAARRRLAQAEHGVQHRALRPVRGQDARVRRHRRRPDAPVRQGRQPAHGVPPPARQLRRPAARRDPGRLRRDLRRRRDGRPAARAAPTAAGDDAFAS